MNLYSIKIVLKDEVYNAVKELQHVRGAEIDIVAINQENAELMAKTLFQSQFKIEDCVDYGEIK